MTERRYNEAEVSTIFAKAVEGPPSAPVKSAGDEGLTLVELQQIGREIGLTPDVVAHAARTLDSEPQGGVRRVLGMPIGVERTIVLNRWMTDAEWEQLVVKLREVFHARGRVSAYGTFRQWTNGNLQALLEPTPTGHRLRLTTTKGSARTGVGAGLAMVGMSSIVGVVAATGHFAASLPGIAMMALMGASMIGYSVAPLRSWARVRGYQMDAIIDSLRPPG